MLTLSSSVTLSKHLRRHRQSGPVFLASTTFPVVGDVYCSPLFLFALATALFHESGFLGRFLGRLGVVSLDPFEELPLPAVRSVRATVASIHSPLGPGSSFGVAITAVLSRNEIHTRSEMYCACASICDL